ncbi:MAG: ABC transporter ATP-binding protein [Pseudomonadota bacterium]
MNNTYPSPETIIALSELYKCYWVGDVAFPALNGVNLTVDRGEFMVLAGRSGSGKTTLLNIIGGLEVADHGSVKVCHQDFGQRNRDERASFRLNHVGFVFQAYNLIRVLSARENVAFVCQLQGLERRQCLDIADRWLDEVGLREFSDRRPDQLSGGQQQRVAVARALATNPDLVLADEPTANLDTTTGKALIALIKRLNMDLGTTFIISSHDPDVIENAGRLIPLVDGRVADDKQPPSEKPSATLCPPPKCSLQQRLWRLLGLGA